MDSCTICGKDLPNRYAVAGHCEEAGCANPFCSLHWHRGNRRCREHGYEEEVQSPKSKVSSGPATDNKTGEIAMTSRDQENTPKTVDPSRAKKLMQDTLTLVKKMGAGAIELLKKLKKDRSPQAMLKTIEDSQAANQARREVVSARVEALYKQISEKKKAYESAPPARKRILETELRSKLAEYKASERELSVLLENETVLSQTKGRLHEITAYGMAGVSEVQIDDIIDEIEESVSEAEGRLDAARDLEKAGRRRERESDHEGLLDELKGFDEEKPSKLSQELADFEEPADQPKKKEAEEV